ncbi:MAG: hypothetical protein ING10_05715 [Roseomonas sp.]|nr:hypothetical protein [Roseomonas sp.]
MNFAQSIEIGAAAERRAIDAFLDAGWCCIGHGLAQVGRTQLPLITRAGQKPSTDFCVFKKGDSLFVEVKSKEPLQRGGFGLDAAQWESLLDHDSFTPGRVLLVVEDRHADELLVAPVKTLKGAADWSLDGRYAIFPYEVFRPLAVFLKGWEEWTI